MFCLAGSIAFAGAACYSVLLIRFLRGVDLFETQKKPTTQFDFYGLIVIFPLVLLLFENLRPSSPLLEK